MRAKEQQIISRMQIRTGPALCTLLLCAAIAAEASAAVLPVTGTLTLQLGNRQPIAATGAGSAIVNGSGGGSHLNSLALPAGVFQSTAITVGLSDPATFVPFAGLQLTVANGAGTFMSGAGAIPLAGVAKLCAFGSCASAVANLSVPLSVVGNGGTAFVTGAINATVIGAPWTTGTVAADGGYTAMGYRHGPASATSSTAAASGQLQLVTPIFISTNTPGDATISAFAVMALHFVPEPATLLLITCGIAVLGVGARRARR